jgi:hypothetical protein
MKKAASILFISATLILAPVSLAYAQKQATISRIGVLLLGAPPNANLDAFIQGLRELGYIERRNILIEYRFAEGKADRLPELAMELVRLKGGRDLYRGHTSHFRSQASDELDPYRFLQHYRSDWNRRCC